METSAKRPQKPSCFCYSLVIQLLLSMLCGNLRFHVSLINAAAGCRKYNRVRYRIISIDETSYKAYLSYMKNGQRDVPEEIRILFRTGEFDGIMHRMPSAELFREITDGHIIFKRDDDELVFREVIREALLNGENPHLAQKEIDDLITSSKKDDIAIFIFNCIFTAVMCKWNTPQAVINETDKAHTEAKTTEAVDKMTKAEKEAARALDDTDERT